MNSLFIVFGIVFIVVVFWIWKYKNWSNIKKGALTIILAAGLLAAVYASFGLILIYSDHAGYSTTGSNLGEIDYDEIISNVKKAGYKVDGPYYVNTKDTIGVHPSNIKELDERFGEDYRFLSVTYYYRENVYFSTWHSESGTDISFYNEDRPDTLAPFKPEDLPPDEWIVEKFRLMFGITEQESRDYLTQLKDSISNSQEESGKISIRKGLDIASVYSNLKETSTNSNVSPTSGEGWITETFYNQDKKIGVLDFLVTNTRVILQDNGHEYTIKIDRLGGVDMEIKLSTREQIPEEEYRRIFKDMFADLGLPAEKVDEFEFEYIPGLW
ncbi:MAG: hypothetical protein HF977_06445 [ANME-2 cluster archaeon]|nr:hypothetical protein [ANME-2 cluster archaeon]